MSDRAPDARTVLFFAHRHGQLAHGQRAVPWPDHGLDGMEGWRSAERAHNAPFACARAAARHARLVESFSSICVSLREVPTSKSMTSSSVELSSERLATSVQVMRTHARVSHARTYMQKQNGKQPFSEKFPRAGMRIRV